MVICCWACGYFPHVPTCGAACILLKFERIIDPAGADEITNTDTRPRAVRSTREDRRTDAGTGLLLPTLLTWAINRLRFEQRGRDTGLWTGTLFIGQFLSPLLVAGFGAATGGLRPALGMLAVVAAVLAVVTLVVVPRDTDPLNVTAD